MLSSLTLLACAHAPAPPSAPPEAPPDANASLHALLADHWEDTMRRSPIWASRLGDHRWDDRLDDNSPEALAAARQARVAFLRRAEAVPAGELDDQNRANLEIFTWELRTSVGVDACHTERWGLSARNNALITIGELPDIQPILTATDATNYLARLRAWPATVDNEIAHLRRGIAADTTPERRAVEIVIGQVDQALSAPAAEWPAAAIAAGPGWPSAVAPADVRDAVELGVLPAMRRYRSFLASELLAAARRPDRAGLWAMPGGPACYAALIERDTSLNLQADAIHAVGLAELERIHDEFRALGQKVFGTSDLPTIFERLRTDPALRFGTEDEVEAAAAAALSKARAAIPAFFGRLPKAECGVRRVPAYEAPFTTIAYYRQSVPGEQPGYYYINTYQPDTRPRFEAEVLAFHESIPGHHLQIAIAQELPNIPEFRRHMGTTAFVEGWALYTERLADEMGLYTGDLDRMGILSFDAWRAARLVVDTGLHAQGWDRAQAIAFFEANTPLARNNIANEVDRYITWPGQALAYKLGHIELRTLRADAEAALGPRFSLPEFHDAVLSGGAVPLPVLRRQVRAWVAGRGG